MWLREASHSQSLFTLSVSDVASDVAPINCLEIFQYTKRVTPTRRHSSRMRTDHAVTRLSNDRVAMRSIVNKMTDTRLWKYYFPLRPVIMSFNPTWFVTSALTLMLSVNGPTLPRSVPIQWHRRRQRRNQGQVAALPMITGFYHLHYKWQVAALSITDFWLNYITNQHFRWVYYNSVMFCPCQITVHIVPLTRRD